MKLLNLGCCVSVTVRWHIAIASCRPGRRLTGRALAGPQEQEEPGSVSQREAQPAVSSEAERDGSLLRGLLLSSMNLQWDHRLREHAAMPLQTRSPWFRPL